MAGNAEVPLAACGLAPSVLAALFRAGFRYKSDLMDILARELANEAQISMKEAAAALESARIDDASSAPVGATALDILQEVIKTRPIAMMLGGFDDILGGGLQRGEVTEICGSPGTGKTQFGIHACLAAQYVVDGAEKRSSAIFIDSEGSFIVERVASMASHFIEDFRQLGSRQQTRDDLLRGINYYRVHDYLEQIEVLHSLPARFRVMPKCKLVVVDTVAFHFRHGFEDYAQRTRALDNLANFLHKLAVDFNVAVVLINHMTTKSSSNERQDSLEWPALGESWSHSITTRVALSWEANCRMARIIKSATLEHSLAPFQVSERGLRIDDSRCE